MAEGLEQLITGNALVMIPVNRYEESLHIIRELMLGLEVAIAVSQQSFHLFGTKYICVVLVVQVDYSVNKI
jgi:uncharacterized membrane protein YgaE (UPF0421/DUF939 family)